MFILRALFGLSLCLPATGAHAQGWNVDLVATHAVEPAPCWSVCVKGGLAYAVVDCGLQIVDVSDPHSPSNRGRCDGRRNWDIDVSGGFAYATHWLGGLEIFDVSDPDAPFSLAFIGLAGQSYEVQVEGHLAYVADSGVGLAILDVSDPSSPTILGAYDTRERAHGLHVSGNLAYVAVDNTGLYVLDVSDPTSPMLRSVFTGVPTARDVHVSNGVAYVAAKKDGLYILDVTNPDAPVLCGTYDTPDHANHVFASGSLAYIADWNGGLQVIDGPRAGVPFLRGSYDTPGTAGSLDVAGGLIYVCDREVGLMIFRLGDLPAPAIAASPGLFSISVQEGQTAAAQTLEVWNDGAGTLQYDITPSSAGLLDVQPATGQSTGDHIAHTVTFNTAGLLPGTHNASLTITANATNSPLVIPVDVTITPVQPPPTCNLEWATYLGGSNVDHGRDVATDPAGNVFVLGRTSSTDFPTFGGYDTRYSGGRDDVFLSRFDAHGNCLWSTYLGGAARDGGYRLATDPAGNVYVTGYTGSTDFPTSGGYDTTYNGGDWDGFAAKFSPAGVLLWSTFLGGSGTDCGYGIAVDAAGHVYIAGETQSQDFPMIGGLDTTYNGGPWDAFLAKFDASGALVWSTYFGGNGDDRGVHLALGPSDSPYIVVQTFSSDFPTPAGYDTTYNGGRDGIVAKFSRDGVPVWSTYVGGTADDTIACCAVDTEGNVCAVGNTESTDFPTHGGLDSVLDGTADAFVTKFDANGILVWSRFLGGSDSDGCGGVATDLQNCVYIAGITGSDFPATGGWDTTHNGGADGFVAKLTSGGVLEWGSFLGGSAEDRNHKIAVHPDGGLCVQSTTLSSDFPTPNGWDTTYNGGRDTAVAKFSSCAAPVPVNLTVSNVDAGPAAPVELRPGDPLLLGAFLENTETWAAGPFWLEFWGSRTGGLTLDRFLGDSRWFPGLSGGEVISLTDSTLLYDVPDGPYTVVFAVDRPGEVAETNERDNRAVVAGKRILVFRPPADTDLAIEEFTFGPNPVYNGRELQLGGHVRNIGTDDTGPFWIEFWGSFDLVYPDLHFFLCDSIRVENLAPGEAVALSEHKRFLYDCPTGIFMAGVYADRLYSVNERDETNNYTFIGGVAFNRPLPAAKAQTGGPDLVVESADFAPYTPAKAQAGSPLWVLARVENRGTEAAGPFWVEFWGATLGGLRLSEFLVDSDRVAGLPPGEGVDLAFERPLYSLADGPYTVDVVVDRPDTIAEMDEGNNRFAVPGKRLLVVRPQSQANLVIEGFGIGPNPIQMGGPIALTGAVRNTGTEHTGYFWIEFWGSHDQDYPDLGFILCDSIFVDDLEPGASIDLSSYSRNSYSWLPPGDCAVLCFADRTDLVNETNEADNYSILRGWQIDM